MKQNKFRKLLKNEIIWAIGIIAAVVTIFNLFLGPSQRNSVEIRSLQESFVNLRDNHIHSLQEDVKELKAGNVNISDRLIRLETILDERLPSKK